MDNFNTNSAISLEQTQSMYSDSESYYDSLDESDKRWIDKIRALKVGRYDADFGQVLVLSRLHHNNAIDAFSDIFHLGFMKGMHAEQARMKKKEAQKKTRKERVLN